MSNITTATVQIVESDTAKIGKEGVALVKRLREIAAIEKAARDVEAEKKEIIASLKEIGGGAKHLTFGGVVIATRTTGATTGIDAKALLAAFPEAHAATFYSRPWVSYRGA